MVEETGTEKEIGMERGKGGVEGNGNGTAVKTKVEMGKFKLAVELSKEFLKSRFFIALLSLILGFGGHEVTSKINKKEETFSYCREDVLIRLEKGIAREVCGCFIKLEEIKGKIKNMEERAEEGRKREKRGEKGREAAYISCEVKE